MDRLLHALTVARDSDAGSSEIAVREKGISSLVSLLFAKYQMFRSTELRERFARFGLELHADKTRLIEFGRYVVKRTGSAGATASPTP